jgi:hypothetical protein
VRVLYLLVLAGSLLAPSGKAATYYISPEGNDSGAGTPDAPFCTLMRGAMAAGPGDTVLVRDGTYGHETAVSAGDGANTAASPVILYRSGTPDAWITFQAEHKGGAVLDCEFICDSYINLLNASYVVIQGFVITRGYKEGIHSNDAAHHITLRGNRFEYIANRTTSTSLGLDGMYTNPNCHDFIIDGNTFHDIGRTNDSQLDHGLYLHGTNFTIVNNIFYNIQHGWAIQAGQALNNVLIANNTFASLDGIGPAGQIMLWKSVSSLTIQNNIFYYPGSYAIVRYASSLTTCSIDHNLVYGAIGLMLNSSGCDVGTNHIGPDPMFVNGRVPPSCRISSSTASSSSDAFVQGPSRCCCPHYDFHLQPGSPGIDTGVTIAAVASDFDGLARPQGSSMDIGAYEYPVSTPMLAAISGINVWGVMPDSVIINWSTDKATTSSVQYGIDSYTGSTPMDPALVNQHSATISNLAPSTQYQYRVVSQDNTGNLVMSADSTFTTATLSVVAASIAASDPIAPSSDPSVSTTVVVTWTIPDLSAFSWWGW